MKTHKMKTNTVIEYAIILLTGLSIVRGQSLTEKIPLGKSILQIALKYINVSNGLSKSKR